MDRTTEDDDGHIGEATGEEGGESGRGAVVRPGGLGRSRRRWCRRGQRGWRRKHGQRHGKRRGKRRRKRPNLVNEGSGDYALRVASNRDETGIRVGPRRTIRARTGVDKGGIVGGRAALDRVDS